VINTLTLPAHLPTQVGAEAAPYTTYRIGGPMALAFLPTTIDEALEGLKVIHQQGYGLTILGWGSNSIVATQGIKGVTLITRKLRFTTALNAHRFEVGAGVHLAHLATTAQQHGLGGAEFMIGIPATLGGAVRMNAGAMGQETAQVVESVTLFNRQTGQVERWTPDRLNYRYRHSDLDPAHHVVLSAVICLKPGDSTAIAERMQTNVVFRKTHHPVEPNGGSVFQNPAPDHTVGHMLDQLNAKGWQVGQVMISPRHVYRGTSANDPNEARN
jgi:UDP-N-acetylmuramate dehydrogenase